MHVNDDDAFNRRWKAMARKPWQSGTGALARELGNHDAFVFPSPDSQRPKVKRAKATYRY